MKKYLKNYKKNIEIMCSIFFKIYRFIYFEIYSFIYKNTTKILHIGQINSPHFTNLFKTIFTKNNKVITHYFICSNQESIFTLKGNIYDNLNYLSKLTKEEWENHIYYNGKNPIKLKTKIEQVINKWDPNHIWIHDLQAGGYPLNDINEDLLAKRKIIATTYGNDLYFYRDKNTHQHSLINILKKIDFLHVETQRDQKIATELGYSGKISFPISATLKNITTVKTLNEDNIKNIDYLIKGSYKHRSVLNQFYLNISTYNKSYKNKKIVIFSASQEDKIASIKLSREYFLDITCLDGMPQIELINLMKRSKFHLTFTLSDGVANTCVESAINDCLPIITKHNGFIELLNDEISELLAIPIPIRINLANYLDNIYESNTYSQSLKAIKSNIDIYFSKNKVNDFRKLIDDIIK